MSGRRSPRAAADARPDLRHRPAHSAASRPQFGSGAAHLSPWREGPRLR